MSRKMPRAQFHRAGFCVTSAEPRCSELDPSLPPRCTLFPAVKCALCLISSNLPRSSLFFCLPAPRVLFSLPAFLRGPSILPSLWSLNTALCLAFETALGQTFRDGRGGAMLGQLRIQGSWAWIRAPPTWQIAQDKCHRGQGQDTDSLCRVATAAAAHF